MSNSHFHLDGAILVLTNESKYLEQCSLLSKPLLQCSEGDEQNLVDLELDDFLPSWGKVSFLWHFQKVLDS